MAKIKVKVLHVDGWDHGWGVDDIMDLTVDSFTARDIVTAILCCTEDCPASQLEDDEIEYFMERCEAEENGVISIMDEGDGYHCIKMG